MTKKEEDYTEIVDADLSEDGPSSEIAQFLYNELPDTLPQGQVSYQQMIQDILSAETVDAVLTPLEAEQLSEFVNQNMVVNSYSLNESDFDRGGYYAALKVTLESDGSKHVLTCGHQTVVAQLIAIERLEGFPFACFPQPAKKPNKHGTFMIRLHGTGG